MTQNEFANHLAAFRAADPARERLLELAYAYLRELANRLPATPGSDLSGVVHDAAVVVVGVLADFRGQSLGDFFSWLKAIFDSRVQKARRHANSGCRDERLKVSLDEAADPPAADPTPSVELRKAEDFERLRREVACLPERQRLAFRLHEEHGLSSREIADMFGESDQAIRALVRSAIAHLRQVLGVPT